jgi:transmembrane sensor
MVARTDPYSGHQMNIHELIVREIRGEARAEDLATLEAWRNSSPRHEAEYRRLRRVLSLVLESEGADASAPPSAARIIAVARDRRDSDSAEFERDSLRGAGGLAGARNEGVPNAESRSHPEPEAVEEGSSRGQEPSPLFGRREWGEFFRPALAAALILAVLGLGYWFVPSDGPGQVESVTATTGPDQRETLRLGNGTVIHLAASTRIEVTEGAELVDIDLDGRAFLAVDGGSGLETRIRTSAGEAVVLGTRFEVANHDDEFHLLVVDGRVGLESRSGQVEVGKGQRSLLKGGALQRLEPVDDPISLLGWMDRTMVFQETPLADAAAEIEWHYEVKVKITDPALAERTVTTAFDGEALEKVIAVLCRTLSASCALSDGVVTISPGTAGLGPSMPPAPSSMVAGSPRPGPR